MKYNYNLLVLVILINGCDSANNKTAKVATNIFHYNVTVAADLSNRLNRKLYPKAVSDTSIVNVILDNIYPKILKHKRSMNQLDQFRIDFINKKQISAYKVQTKSLEIDFKRFGNKQSERIDFLKSKFQKDKQEFKNEFERINESATIRPYGSDIWTYLNEGVDNTIVDTTSSYSKFDGHEFLNRRKNVLILITDGYIESGIYGKGFDLSKNKFDNFRKEYNKSGESDLNKFYKEHKQFHIIPFNNPLLKNLNILVLEMYDRSESNQGATIHPTDMQIMKIFWTDWLKRSGVKDVELHSKFSNRTEAEKVIMRYLGV